MSGPDADVTACCDPLTGTCTETESTCPEGFTSLGLGTDCNPNCCEQPVDTGGDNCDDAIVHQITVPPPGETTVVTITGDSTPATGPDSCNFDSFTELGEKGWWEAFAIDDCGFVTIAMCCSDPVLAGYWPFVTPECPCESTINLIGHGGAIDPPPSLCPNDINEMMFFAPLPAGTYYHPILTIFGDPGPYQLNIFVRGCELAACCLESTCEMLNELECDALGGYFLGGITDSWGFIGQTCGDAPDGTDNPCLTGSCCVGPGECIDGFDINRITEASCDLLGGTFVGGAECHFVESPCPVCEMEGPKSCQLIDDLISLGAAPSDLSAPGGPMVRADDFVPLTDSISKVCVWGRYFDITDPDGDGSIECVQAVTDDFQVTIFADAGGIPGDVVARSTVSSPARMVRPPPGESSGCDSEWGDVYSYQLELDDPITGMTPGECHWLEVTNNTASPEDVEPNRCAWQWTPVADSGNDYSFAGSHDGAFSVYEDGGQRSSDLSFCLDTDFEPGGCGQLQRACCTCPDEGDACTIETFANCSDLGGRWFRGALTCSEAPCPIATPPGDDCATDAIPITGDVSINFDTTCTTTDGPGPLLKLPNLSLGSDIWFEYTTSCTGRLIASMCASESQYDSVLGAFFDPTNPAECVCPGESNATLSGNYSDEGCDGCPNAGAGYLIRDVFPGQCWLIRVAGFAGNQGVGRLDLTCEERFCPTSSPVEPEMIPNQFGTPTVSTKNRFLSFSAGDAGLKQAIRVTFLDLPTPYDDWIGTQLWVGEPSEVTTCGLCGPIANPPTITVATMSCDSPPGFHDWHDAGLVHVFHEGIVPGGTYRLDVIDEACSVSTDDNFSLSVKISTAKWGDTIGTCDVFPCTPPDGKNQITDILAIINRFVGHAEAIEVVRADLEPVCIDLTINITDALHSINAFMGLPYPFEPTASDPCDSTCFYPWP